ncbi:protein arginine N-methyltransferase 1 [Nilaparvata lugens]|uniref:protein arginine N-methyltransferase 1 n=1 Tax=Nilaparvata lugens TaxID=108931 RepID=UPI00193D96DA|nr:protein arginine N-methyltransferase 1 [Nilaparvata lugens]
MDDVHPTPVTCLFCKEAFPNIDEAIVHCRDSHLFDLAVLKLKLVMDCYSYIKLINYIRSENPRPEYLSELCKDPPWIDEKYLKPILEDDPWLLFDFDDLEVPSNIAEEMDSSDVRDARIRGLERKNKELNSRIMELEDQHSHLMCSLEDMRKKWTNLMFTDDSKKPKTSKPQEKGAGDSNDCEENKDVSGQDRHYFDSYSHFGIHHEMLSDRVRTESYRNALLENSALLQDKIVLDLGCGTGILAMFAAKAGARRVVAVDQSEIVYDAIHIVWENNLKDKVDVIKGKIETTKLPVEKVDLIVSEWMGYFLLFEAMLDSVIYARDRYLASGGILIPNRCTISLAGFSSLGRYKDLVEFWDDVYGYKMSNLKKQILQEPLVEVVKASEQATESTQIHNLDLMTATVDSVNFTCNFSLKVIRDSDITSIVGYFDTFFELPNPVSFSTGPHATPTHWKQTVFLLKEKVPVKKGEVLSGKINCVRDSKEKRSLRIKLQVKDQSQEYLLH